MTVAKTELDDGWVNWGNKPEEPKPEAKPGKTLTAGEKWEQRMKEEIEGEGLMAK